MTTDWDLKQMPLRFRLGELTLFSLKMQTSVCNIYFNKISTNPDYPVPPFHLFKNGVDVVAVRSHPIATTLPPIARIDGAIRYIPLTYDRHFVDLRGTFANYLTKFSSKTRSTLQRKVRKFAESNGGNVDWREYRSSDEMREFHRFARSISAKTYQERLLDSGLPDAQKFIDEIVARAAAGTARGYLLFLAGESIAYIYCPITDGVLFYDYVGFDPIHGKLSPGTVLQYLVLEKLFNEGGFQSFDFTEGEGSHKELFATHAVACADIYFFRPSVHNAVLLRLHRFLDTFSTSTVKLLDRMGLKAKLKKLLRKHA